MGRHWLHPVPSLGAGANADPRVGLVVRRPDKRAGDGFCHAWNPRDLHPERPRIAAGCACRDTRGPTRLHDLVDGGRAGSARILLPEPPRQGHL